MLILCGVAVPSFLAAAVHIQDSWLQRVLVIASIGLVFCVVIAYGYFALTNPSLLQSEDFQLRRESLEIIRTKGGKIRLADASIEAIANPGSRPELEAPSE